MEPCPTPNIVRQSLEAILQKVSFADRIIFGRTNYSKVVSGYPGVKSWYNDHAAEVQEFCERCGIESYIKHGAISAAEAVRSERNSNCT